MIQRKAMAGDPAGNSDTDRRELFLADPHSGEPINSSGRDAVVAGDSYEHFLEIPNVAVHVTPVGLQVDDWIADDLPGTVVGDVAAATGFEDLNPARGKRLRRRQDVRTSAVTAHAQRQHRGMFDQQQLIADGIRATLFNQFTLERQRLGITDHSQPANFKWLHEDADDWVTASITQLPDYSIARLLNSGLVWIPVLQRVLDV